MNTEVWYLPHFEGVYHTRMIETFSNVNACMVRMVHTMVTTDIFVQPIHKIYVSMEEK